VTTPISETRRAPDGSPSTSSQPRHRGSYRSTAVIEPSRTEAAKQFSPTDVAGASDVGAKRTKKRFVDLLLWRRANRCSPSDVQRTARDDGATETARRQADGTGSTQKPQAAEKAEREPNGVGSSSAV